MTGTLAGRWTMVARRTVEHDNISAERTKWRAACMVSGEKASR